MTTSNIQETLLALYQRQSKRQFPDHTDGESKAERVMRSRWRDLELKLKNFILQGLQFHKTERVKRCKHSEKRVREGQKSQYH